MNKNPRSKLRGINSKGQRLKCAQQVAGNSPIEIEATDYLKSAINPNLS